MRADPDGGVPGAGVRPRHAAAWLTAALIAGAAAVLLLRASQGARELPVYWAAPEFSLVDQQGETLTSDDLRGAVWVASFVFTHCPDICPLITAKKARLRDALAEDGLLGRRVRLVSISVDPARDTPEVLLEYAARFGGSPPADWAFLTGASPDELERIVQGGFRLTTVPHRHEEAVEPPEDYRVMHTPRLALVDHELRIRGFYDSAEPDAVERLERDLRLLIH